MSIAPYDGLEKDFKKYERREFSLQLFCAVVCGFIAGIGVGFFMAMSPASSAERLHPDKKSAYHWWSYACCNENDCGPATEGQVKVTDKGYIVTTPDGTEHLLHWKDTRIKKKPADNPYAYDGKHHVCQDTYHYGGEWYVRCLYPALQGF